jgi:hypothetical protein
MYSASFIQRRGLPCAIHNRVVDFPGGGAFPSESFEEHEGYILLGVRRKDWGDNKREAITVSPIVTGDAIVIGSETYFVMAAYHDAPVGVYVAQLAKVNVNLVHKRWITTYDEYGNPTTEWQTITALLPAYAEIVTPRMRQEDLGLLETTVIVFYTTTIPKVEDRLSAGDRHYKVDVVDTLALNNLAKVQGGIDNRP